MLKEIAFTPAVFDESAQSDKSDWRDQLKELLGVLAPKGSVCPVIVSNLYGSSWYHEIERSLKSVEDHKLKAVCQAIMEKMKDRLVSRPACSDYPMDDATWCREALASHAIEPIDRIVATNETRVALIEEASEVRGLDEIEHAGFWHGVNVRAWPEPFFEDQIVLLRKLCIHSEWIALSSPYANTTEMDFTIEFLRTALSRPVGFQPVEIEIHFDNWNRGSSSPGLLDDRTQKQAIAARFIAHKLTRMLPSSSTVQFFCWEKLLERTLIAGDFTTDGNGVKRRRARWGLSMTHVARKRRPKVEALAEGEQETEPHRWSLMDKHEIVRPFESFLDDVTAIRPTPTSL
ncbi:MAG: hypothetical protein RIC55_21780 [Pirellulaceae bacterium]